MDDRSNTIAGWVLAGGIAALGLSIASGKKMYFHSAAPHKPGYAIEGVEASRPETMTLRWTRPLCLAAW